MEITLHYHPIYALIRSKHNRGMVFAEYRIESDYKATPRIIKIAELAPTIYHTHVLQYVRRKLQGRIVEGRPTWHRLCAMSSQELEQLTKISSVFIRMTLFFARENANAKTLIESR